MYIQLCSLRIIMLIASHIIYNSTKCTLYPNMHVVRASGLALYCTHIIITLAVHSFHCSFVIKTRHLSLQKNDVCNIHVSQLHHEYKQGDKHSLPLEVFSGQLHVSTRPPKHFIRNNLHLNLCHFCAYIFSLAVHSLHPLALQTMAIHSTYNMYSCTYMYHIGLHVHCMCTMYMYIQVHVRTVHEQTWCCSWACSAAMVSLRVWVSCSRASLSVESNWDRSSPTADSWIGLSRHQQYNM